jgi:hypothetical protein
VLDSEAYKILECFYLALNNNVIDYGVVKDYCALQGLESIVVFSALKEVLRAI